MSKPTALVIGGTGPTGPPIVEGLHRRGYVVSILHTGQHEVEFSVPDVEHIHEDPHFAETLLRGLGSRTFDLVIAQYGRLRIIAECLATRTDRLIAIGAANSLYASGADERWGGMGRPQQFPDTTTIYRRDEGAGGFDKVRYRMVQAMEALFENVPHATYVGYPVNYGPRNPGSHDWCVIRRILDGRSSMIIADGGIKLESRVFSENAAAAILLVVDSPDVAAGKRYTVTDENVYSVRQRIQFVASYMNHELELIDLPYPVAWPCYPYYRHHRGHLLSQSALIRHELGYRDQVTTEEGMARTVEWLLEHRPEQGGEIERQIGDPFDYPAEDALVRRWSQAEEMLGNVEHSLSFPGHQYRHPKTPGEAWSAPEDSSVGSPE